VSRPATHGGLWAVGLLGTGIGVLMAGPLFVFGVRGLFLAAAPVGGAALAVAVRWYTLPLWVPLLGIILVAAALPAAELAQLHYLISRVPVAPGTERLERRAGLAGWENGPFGQVELRTTSGFDDVVAFYRTALTRRGRKPSSCFRLPDQGAVPLRAAPIRPARGHLGLSERVHEAPADYLRIPRAAAAGPRGGRVHAGPGRRALSPLAGPALIIPGLRASGSRSQRRRCAAPTPSPW
jgi:hypothetical protein